MTTAEPTPARGSRSLLLMLVSVALALLAGEGLVRALDLGPSFEIVYGDNFELSDDPVLGYALRPGSPDGTERINRAGFRDRDVPVEKPEGVFRVAAIGDSITFGHGFSQHEAYPKRLEQLLNAAAREGGPRYEVLNFGVSGYNIAQIVERLRVLALRYQPDLVLYGYTLNDPQEYSFEAGVLEGLREVQGRRRDEGAAGGFGRLLAHSRLFLMARHLLTQGKGGGPSGIEIRLDPGFVADARGRRDRYFRGLHRREDPRRRFEQGVADLADLSRAHGVPIVVAIFPLFGPAGQAYALADVHEWVASEARARGLEVVDLQPAFEAARSELGVDLHTDLMHPNALGHRVAASALLERLAARTPEVFDLDVSASNPGDAPDR